MKLVSKIFSVVIGGTLLFASAGCSSGTFGQSPAETSSGTSVDMYDYTVRHSSYDKVLRFFSSDSDMDAFLNDYFMRHMRYTEGRIHDFPIGAGQPVWKEWETMIGCFWDASTENLTSHYATNRWIREWLTLDYMSRQDRQGYISTSDGIGSDDWGQGWAFPGYTQNSQKFNSDFLTDTEGWTGEGKTTVTQQSSDGGEGYLKASVSSADEIVLLSPVIREGKGTNAFYSPFLHFSWQLQLDEGSDGGDIDDLYVYFRTENSPEWSDDKCVRYSEYASVTLPFEEADGVWQGTFLNMFLNGKWGRDSVNANQVTQLKFVLKVKDGAELGGHLLFDFIRTDFDDRMGDNCGQYISAAKHFLSYTQDVELLKTVLPVARGAMQFYLTCLDGEEAGLISNAYLVGHFNYEGSPRAGTGIGDGYWDAVSFPNVNLYSNLSYHQALVGMLYLEQMAENYRVTVPEVTVLGKDMKTPVTYRETVESLTRKLERCETLMRETFWNEQTGRFAAGYYDTEDGSGTTDRMMDYGFLMFNLQVVTDGIATEDQAESIMRWVSGERIVEGDDSTGEDIYKFLFAPRFSTRNNTTDGVWCIQQATWECGVRNGGAVMQTSYYDMVARSKVSGGDDAFARLKGIQDFYYRVRAAGGTGIEFYREYFNGLGIGMQGNYHGGGDNEGPIGIDCEFLEAALMFVSIPDAFFGMEPSYEGVLSVQPNMPTALDYWRMENLLFGGVSYDLSIGKYFVQLSNIKAENELSMEVKLAKPNFKFRVCYDGENVSYREENGYIIVKVPFINGKVEIKGV